MAAETWLVVAGVASAQDAAGYRSGALGDLVEKASHDLDSGDYEHSKSAVDLFFDLRRTDYFVSALSSRDYNLRMYTLELVKKLPTTNEITALIGCLENVRVFALEKGGEQAAAQTTFFERLNKILKQLFLSHKKEFSTDSNLCNPGTRQKAVNTLQQIQEIIRDVAE